MSLNLTKGETLDLTKEVPELKSITGGLGWDAAEEGKEIDLDASALLLVDGKVTEERFIYFRHLESADGTVKHTGDNLTGAGDGDDEQIKMKLSDLPATVEAVVLVINSYSGQTFGEVKNAVARVVNDEDSKELVRYELGSEYHTEKAVEMARLQRTESGWEFQAVGAGYDDIKTILAKYGLNA